LKPAVAFIFFLLFLAGLALVNLRGIQAERDSSVREAGQLTGVNWRLTHLGEMVLADDTDLTIEFDRGGKVQGFGGCNRFSGSFALQQGKLSVGPLAVTRKACPEPANSFEISYLDALDKARAAARAERRLALQDADGRTLARFVASDRDVAPR